MRKESNLPFCYCSCQPQMERIRGWMIDLERGPSMQELKKKMAFSFFWYLLQVSNDGKEKKK